MSLMAVRIQPYQIINLMLICVFISLAVAIFLFSKMQSGFINYSHLN